VDGTVIGTRVSIILTKLKKMKHLLLFFSATILFTATSFSQIKQGTWMAGGSLGLNGKSTNGNSYGNVNDGTSKYHSNGVNLNGRTGYFLRDNLVIGLSPGYGHNGSSSKSNNINPSSFSNYTNKYQWNSYSISPFIRKYKQLFNSKVSIFGQASINLGYSIISQNYLNTDADGNITSGNTSTNKATSERIFLSPGINYFITDRIALEVIFAGLGLGVEKQKINETYNANNVQVSSKNTGFDYQLNLNLSSVNLGVQFFLGKKQEASKKEGL
jgi:hypothetical protein